MKGLSIPLYEDNPTQRHNLHEITDNVAEQTDKATEKDDSIGRREKESCIGI